MKTTFTFFSIFTFLTLFFQLSAQNNCNQAIDPVCGDNGVTYINSCYAEAAGVVNYSSGLCYSDCIDHNLINPNAVCGTVYEPVCGCNGVTYLNACVAEAAGVTSYTTGQCNGSCYYPEYAVASSEVVLDWANGIISESCGNTSNPVCGCDGITYLNPCLASASGVIKYTYGSCDSLCVDPNSISNAANCGLNDDPVCGCNDVTYGNACLAQAAGVVSYTTGPCQSSTWCSSATLIQCGDFLSSETNSGGTNIISQYPNCINATLEAPEKVYKIHKTTTGDLQIGLEIISAGLDLDLFLLSDECNAINCIKASTSNNTQSNNEGILFEDAPIGTYYIVVDGQYANSVGNYKLEVSCGYLDCSNAETLTCGQTVSGTNLYGADNVSLYSQGNYFNVENNGPEVVYTFSLVSPGNVTINLSGFDQNLELFLLSSCDRGTLLEHSTRSGTLNENISRFLQAGTYYIVVDGYNGAVSDFDLSLSCPASCACTLTATFNTIPANCGQSNGKVIINASGGTAPYHISWTGPVCGTTTSYGNACTVIHLPAGTYSFDIIDANGCTVWKSVTIDNAGSNFDFTANGNSSGCGVSGSIDIAMTGGSAPYSVYVTGPVSFNAVKYTNNFSFNNLPSGAYTICIVDSYGCSRTHVVTVSQGTGSYNVVMNPSPARCESKGKVHVSITGGQPIYQIQVQGPISGGAATASSSFNIVSLPAGTYIIRITDANGCQETQTVTIDNEELDITAQGNNGSCGSEGSIEVFMDNGEGPYQITWDGPVSSTIVTSDNPYIISNLPNGTYNVNVKDANWCMDNQTVFVNSTNGNLDVVAQVTNATCNGLGQIGLDIINGTAPYQIMWTGSVNGSTSATTTWFDINNLPAGLYIVKVTDANGCTKTQTITISGASSDLELVVNGNDATCNTLGSIGLDITGGTGPYEVMWTGPVNGMINITSNWFEITNLSDGSYWVKVTDANGCIRQESVVIGSSGQGFDVSFTSMDGSCSMLGSIWVTMIGGSAPFDVTWTGPVNGSANTTDFSYDINDLPAGSYVVKVTDANGCMQTISTTIQTLGSNLTIDLTSSSVSCGNLGSIWVVMNNGVAPYSITWTGPVSGNVSTNSNQFNIVDLPTGTYEVVVVDENSCTQTENISVNNSGSNVDFIAQVTDASCASDGAVHITVTQGVAPYIVTWNGASSGGLTSNNQSFTITDLSPGNYTIEITDADGCTSYKNVLISYTTLMPSASFSYTVNGLTVDFINTGIGDNFYWTFGDGMTSTTSNPTHQFCEPGSYSVCLVATNSCGTDTVCQTIAVDYPSNTIVLDIGNTAGESGAMVLLPVYVYNATNVLSLTGSIQSTNSTIGVVEGVTAGLINPIFNISDGSFNYFNTNAVSVTDGDILFYINVTILGNSGEQTTIQLMDNPMAIEYGAMNAGQPVILSHYVVHGLAKVIAPDVCYGHLIDMSSNSINNVTMDVTGENFHTSVVSNTNGQFNFNDLPLNKDLVLRPSKSDHIMNGLSTQALFKGQQFILGKEPAEIHSPYQIIAADVNCNNSFTGLDLYAIQQVIVGNQTSFSDCPDWIFVNDDYEEFDDFTTYNVFNYSSVDTISISDFVTTDFIGIKSGDILGHANPQQYQEDPVLNDRADLELFTHNILLEVDQTKEVAIYASNFDDISSLQFTMSFDPAVLEYVEFINSSNDDLNSMARGVVNVNSGKINFSWFNLNGVATSIDNTVPIFTLKFKALQYVENVYEELNVDANGIMPQAFNDAGNELNVDLNETLFSSTNHVGQNSGIQLFQNTPNPASNRTNVSFFLPRALNVSLEVINEMGQQVYAVSNDYEKGNHSVPVITDFASGTYYYTLKTNETTLTKKMVVIK